MSLKSEFDRAVREYRKAQARDYAAEIVLKGVENALPPTTLFKKLTYEEASAGITRYKYTDGKREMIVYTGEEAVKRQIQSLQTETKRYTDSRRYVQNLEKFFIREGVANTEQGRIILNRFKHGDISHDMLFIMDKEGNLWDFSEVYKNTTSIEKFINKLYTETDRRNQIRLQDKANEMNRILAESYGTKEPIKRKRNKERIAPPKENNTPKKKTTKKKTK